MSILQLTHWHGFALCRQVGGDATDQAIDGTIDTDGTVHIFHVRMCLVGVAKLGKGVVASLPHNGKRKASNLRKLQEEAWRYNQDEEATKVARARKAPIVARKDIKSGVFDRYYSRALFVVLLGFVFLFLFLSQYIYHTQAVELWTAVTNMYY